VPATKKGGLKILSYQRDTVVDTEKLVLPFADDVGGTIRGYRIFTACRTVRGKIFRLEDHLDRLYYSASSIHMIPPLPREQLRSLLNELVKKNLQVTDNKDLVIDVIFSGGLSGNTMKLSGKGAHLYVAVQEMESPPCDLYATGASLATFIHQRMCPDVKLMNYMGAILAHQTVVPKYNAYEVLFVCPSDNLSILEGATFSIFFVDSHRDILTPPLDGRILDSVTRRVIFELLRSQGNFRIVETPVRLDMISSLPEAFLASTTRNVLPVTRIDDTVIADGVPGPVSKSVMKLFEHHLLSL
jgi:branched-chain amino acid aminotransferase